MTPFTEDHLIEQPAIQLMKHELGWDSVNAYEPPSSRDAGLWRSSGLMNCPEEAVEANREIDKLLRGGVKVKISDREHGGQRTVT